MPSLEIERKFIINSLDDVPGDLESYPHTRIEQAYLCTNPVVRVRRDGDRYYLTYKGSGMMEREEANLPLTMEAYNHLLLKADGNVISKIRYRIELKNPKVKEGTPTPPSDYTLTVELDVFAPHFAPLLLAEVEFGSKEAAESFLPPEWFGEEVTYRREYHNSNMAMSNVLKPDAEF